MLRKHVGLLALFSFLLWSCQAEDPTANGATTDPGSPKPSDRGRIIELSPR